MKKVTHAKPSLALGKDALVLDHEVVRVELMVCQVYD